MLSVARLDVAVREGPRLILGPFHIDVGVAVADHAGFLHVGIPAVAHDDGESREVAGHFVDAGGGGVAHDRAGNAGTWSGADDHRNLQFTALGIDRIKLAVICREFGEVGIDGRAFHAEFVDHAGKFVDGLHTLVWIEPGHAIEFVGVGPHHFHDAHVGTGAAIGRFDVAPGDDPGDFMLVHDLDDFVERGRPCAIGVVEEGAHVSKEGAVDEPVHGVGRVGAETEIDGFHEKGLLVCWRRVPASCVNGKEPRLTVLMCAKKQD